MMALAGLCAAVASAAFACGIGWFSGWWWLPVACFLALLLVAVVCLASTIRARRGIARWEPSSGERGAADSQARRRSIKDQVRSAIRAVCSQTTPGRSGRGGLYALPWYALVGDSRSGKTLVLERCGLNFAPVGSPQTGEQVPGFEFWYSKEAVVLDTAGALLAPEHSHEWTELLSGLMRYRRRRPLDGVILTLAAERLLAEGRDELESGAHRLRAGLAELQSRLEMVVPIYLLVTKADTIPDFAEFWSDGDMRLRKSPWGATFAANDLRLEPSEAAVGAEIAILGRALHARALQRLGGAEQHRRLALLRFPQAFAALGAQLGCFVAALGSSGSVRARFPLRGFYFCSANTEPSPPRRTSEASRLPPQVGAGFGTRQKGQESHVFFVAELFRRVILADRHLASPSGRRVRRQWQRMLAVLAAAALGWLLVVVPAISSCIQNNELIAETRQVVRRLAGGVEGTRPELGQALDLLLGRVQGLEEAAAKFHVQHWWGPYAAPELRAALYAPYLKRLEMAVAGPVREQLVAMVRSTTDVPKLDSASFGAAHDNLKLYLMLTQPERIDVDWSAAELTRVWARARLRGAYLSEGGLERHARNFTSAVASDVGYAWIMDGALVSRARARLLASPVSEIRYTALRQAARGAPPVRPEHIFLGAAASFVRSPEELEVPGLYTAQGWHEIQPLLAQESTVVVDPWVLGRDEGEAFWSQGELRSSYFERYARAWIDFMAGLDLESPATLQGAIEQLDVLSQTDGPFVRLFHTLAKNVRLKVAEPPLAQAVAEAAGVAVASARREPAVSPVEQQFRGTLAFAFGDAASSSMSETAPLHQYIDQLRLLQVALRQLRDHDALPGTEFEAQLAGTARSVERLLQPLDKGERLALTGLLTGPLRSSRSLVRGHDVALVSDEWRANVLSRGQRLARYYPFDARAAEHAPLEEFSALLAPKEGALWKFFETHLATRVQDSGERFVPRASSGSSLLQPAFLRCLDVAREVRDAVFATEAALPSVPFAIKLLPAGGNVSSLSLDVDGQSAVYKNEPERWQSMKWPGDGSTRGASIVVSGPGFSDEIRHAGEFGLIRLLMDGDIRSVGEGERVLEASWSVRHGATRVRIQIRPASHPHPFRRGFFTRLNCATQPFVASGAFGG